MKQGSTLRINRNNSNKVVKHQYLDYMFNQEAADFQLSLLINSIYQFNWAFETNLTEKTRNLLLQINQNILKLNAKHRSYKKAVSIVNFCNFMVFISQNQQQNAREIINQQRELMQKANQPQRDVKFYILSLLFSTKFHLNQNQAQFFKVNQIVRQIQSTKITNKLDSHQYRLWEHFPLQQIFVYQCIMATQKLSELNFQKTALLFNKIITIANSILGKNHKYILLLQNIAIIRKKTDLLLDSENNDQSKISRSNRSVSKKTRRYKSKSVTQSKTEITTSQSFHSANKYKNSKLKNYSCLPEIHNSCLDNSKVILGKNISQCPQNYMKSKKMQQLNASIIKQSEQKIKKGKKLDKIKTIKTKSINNSLNSMNNCGRIVSQQSVINQICDKQKDQKQQNPENQDRNIIQKNQVFNQKQALDHLIQNKGQQKKQQGSGCSIM